MATSADAAVAAVTRPSLRIGWLVAAAAAAAGAFSLAAVGAPPDTLLVPIAIFAVVAAELMTLDFPDRRGVSVAALPLLLAAAAGGDAVAVWAAAAGTGLASVGHRRSLAQVLFLFGRATLAASACQTRWPPRRPRSVSSSSSPDSRRPRAGSSVGRSVRPSRVTSTCSSQSASCRSP
jgi:hypothetical protein